MTIETLNRALLQVLGLSETSSSIVMEEIESLHAELDKLQADWPAWVMREQNLRTQLADTQRDIEVIVAERDALIECNRELQQERDTTNAVAEEAMRTLQEYAPVILRAEEGIGNG